MLFRRAVFIGALAGALPLVAGIARSQEKSDLGYIEMPAPTDGSYTLASPPGSGHNWGKPDFIRALLAVAREWHRRHPDLPKLCIGDMSHRDASDFPPHVSHKDGLTADIVTRPVNICDIKYPNHDHQIELAELFVAYGARQILFNGDAVIAKIKVAQKHELHDDHYHVVIDTAKTPDDSKPFVLPAGGFSEGATVGGSSFDKDGKSLILRWVVLGGSKEKVKSVSVTLRLGASAKDDEANAALWESGPEKPGAENAIKVPVALVTGNTYRWKLALELASGETVGFDWQTFKLELATPVVALEGPADGAAVTGVPELSWTFQKKGAEQASFFVELSDTGPKKPTVRLGPIEGKGTTFALRATPLRRNQRYYWRVRALDAQGNEGVSEWRSWKTSMDWKFVPPGGSAVRAAELTDATGRATGKLKKGEAVVVIGEGDARLLVRTLRTPETEGFVARADITLR
jgi:hypothetical protein